MAANRSSNASDENYFLGWDLFYNTVAGSITKKDDVLMALAHFVLTKHSNFRCLSTGDSMILLDTEVGSELLPTGWNEEEGKYSLRYVVDNRLYLLLGHISEGSLIINLLNANTKIVSNIMLKPDTLVRDVHVTNINQLIPTARYITNRYRKELIDPVFKRTRKNTAMQTDTAPNNTNSDIQNVSPNHNRHLRTRRGFLDIRNGYAGCTERSTSNYIVSPAHCVNNGALFRNVATNTEQDTSNIFQNFNNPM